MIIDQVLKVKIEKLDHQGRGIAKVDNMVIFVTNALVGEIVKVKINKVKKNFCEGTMVEIIDESPYRQDPICPYYLLCGGCDLMHLKYEKQLEYKENKVKEIMKKFANIDESLVKTIISNNKPYNYRNKTTFQIDNKIGFYSKKSNKVIEIDNCFISDQKINEIIQLFKNIDIINYNKIIIRSSFYTPDSMIIIDSEKIDKDVIINTFKNIVTSIIWKNKDNYICLYGNNDIKEKLNDYEFVISEDSFFQVNSDMTIKLYDKVIEYASPNKEDIVLDLFCGTGTIGLYISKNVKKVIGIELNKNAIKNALINKKINRVDNIDFIVGDANEEIKKILTKPNIIIVDPPRSGLSESGLNTILTLQPNKIIYVSCDPVTLARDLKILQKRYDINEITPFDMFPNTEHVETLVLLTKRLS